MLLKLPEIIIFLCSFSFCTHCGRFLAGERELISVTVTIVHVEAFTRVYLEGVKKAWGWTF